MRKQINKKLDLYFTNNYPFVSKKQINKRYLVTLGIGGNIGNVIHNFNILFIMLKNNSKVKILKTSPILKNPPFGFIKQNYFYNTILLMQTNLNPYEVLRLCWMYEHRFKRQRSFKDAPRTLDMDIIFIKKQNKSIKVNTNKLTIPHKNWQNRQSVIIPLGYI
jgi:2-amino-4-hydroxy-6-hydroxymethyldihydropteridine diphosphokinase